MSLSRLSIRHSQGQIRLYADTQHLQDQITTAQKQLQQVNEIYVSYYNQCWTEIMFKEDNLVLINEKNVSVDKQTKKLHWKKLSSFKIQCMISWLLYELNLSENHNIYNIFNVALLKLFWDTHYMFSTLTRKDLLLNQNNEWEIKVIINSCIQNNRLQYLVKWKSTDQTWNDIWESAHFVCNVKIKIWKFYADNSDKSKSEQTVQCQCD